MEIRIDFEELKRLESSLRAAPEATSAVLLRAMTEADSLLLREVMDRTPTAGGTLRHSEVSEQRVGEFGVQGFVGSPLDYVRPVELGTKPHFPPVEALVDWVKTRFSISSEVRARSVAFLVARKISRSGTKGADMFERAFGAAEPQVRAIFEQASARIAAIALGGKDG